MTITTEPVPLSYSGDDSTTDFAITFKYFAKSHVVVTLRDANDAETTWVLGTNYTLTDADVDTGGTLTATTAPATGETLVISLDPPNTQDSSFPVGGSFPSSTVEDELDQAAQRDGKLETLFNRTLRVPKTDLRTDTDLELPIDTERASKFLKFDANGLPTAAAGTATLGETGLLGQDAESELTIATGSVTPTVSTHSIDTQADAATDDLDTIVTTNLEDGRLLLIRGENAARVVTVRNAQGGAGQINTRNNVNVALDVERYMLLQRRGTDWYEVQLGAVSVVDDTTPELGGALDTNAFAINESEGTAVVSAATCDIWATNGNTVHVTGSTGPITSFGTAPRVGARRWVIFDSTPILTHSANLNLPDAVNYQVVAGDMAYIYADTTTQFDVLIFRSDGLPATSLTDARLWGRSAGSVGIVQEITVGAGLSLSGGALTASSGTITLGTEQASTSGTSIDFTGIPAGTKKITVMLVGVSTNGTSNIMIQLGDAGDFEATGYLAQVAGTAFTTGFGLTISTAATDTWRGVATLYLEDSTDFTWVYLSNMAETTTATNLRSAAGSKSLSAELTRVRITTVNGSDTFDAGAINISYQ